MLTKTTQHLKFKTKILTVTIILTQIVRNRITYTRSFQCHVRTFFI